MLRFYSDFSFSEQLINLAMYVYSVFNRTVVLTLTTRWTVIISEITWNKNMYMIYNPGLSPMG